MSKTIIKVSFKSAGEKGVVIEYENYDENGLKDTTSKVSKHVPHNTFVEAMQNLKTHILLIAEFERVEKFKKFTRIDNEDVVAKDFRVVGFTISGKDEKEGVIITGYRTLSTGHGYAFNTPLTKFENEGETKYKFIGDLIEDIEAVRGEAEEYLKGKYGEPKQGDLFKKEKEEPAEVE